MPIDDLYAQSTGDYLTGLSQVDTPDLTPPPSTGLGSLARATGRGVAQGGLALFGAASDLVSGASQLYIDPDMALTPDGLEAQDKQVNDSLAKMHTGTLFQSQLGTDAYDLIDTLNPDPSQTTAIDRTVQGVAKGLTEYAPGMVLGPAGAAVVGGTATAMERAEDLKRQGVDVTTRTEAGAVEGTLGAVGAVLPMGGSTLGKTAALAGIGGPGLYVAQSAAERAILRNAGYDNLADQEDPFDPVNLAASTGVAALMGGIHLATNRGAAASGAGGVTMTPLTDMSVDARKALPYNAPELDSYAVQAAQQAGVPPSVLLFLKNGGEKSNSNQVSPKGAKGVMQFMDPTFAQFGKGDPTDPVNSIDAGANYLAYLGQKYDGDWRAAVTEYDGGVKQAEAVHAGGAPTSPETIAYLKRFDNSSASDAIDTMSFNPTSDQVDAALGAQGQRMVDDASPYAHDYVFGATSHQDNINDAVQQMSAGGFPNISLDPDGADTFQAATLDDMIGSLENTRDSTVSTASGLQEPGTVSQARSDLDTLLANAPDDSAPTVKQLTRQLQSQGMKFREAQAQVRKQIADAQTDHDAQIARLRGIIADNAEAQRATQAVPDIDRQLDTLRAQRDALNVPPSRRTPISNFVRSLGADDAPRPKAPERERAPIEPVEAPEATAVEPSANSSSNPASAVDGHLRTLAQDDSNVIVAPHPDKPDQTMDVPVSTAMQVIDDEYKADLSRGDWLTAAANCFIGRGDIDA